MSTKRIFSWSKRQSTSSAEPYYRTGGLLPIDANGTSPNDGLEAKTTTKAGRQRPTDLRIIPPENKQYVLSPVSASYNAALANAASNLQAAFNDMLRSPAPTAAACAASPLIQKPLPSRPRSVSAPSTPDLPAELPGSLLQDNQGFPLCSSPVEPTRSTSQTVRRVSLPPSRRFEGVGDPSDSLNLVPGLLTHAKSVQDMSTRHSTMSPLKVQPKKSLSETSSRKRSKPNLVASPSSTDSKRTSCFVSTNIDYSNDSRRARVATGKLLQPSPLIVEGQPWNADVEKYEKLRNELGASTPTPTTTRSKHIEELKATITTQDQTISTLQAQFSSLRSSHEAHVASLAETHAAEIASLKNYVRVLEEQLAQKPSLHHASSNNLLFLLDTTEPPQTPSHESSQNTAGSVSASSITSFQSALEKQQRSPQRLRNSPEMESLKRKLSTTRRPETTNRNLLPELNQYKQNNVALQKQIESLMAKLNESKKSERTLRAALDEVEQKCVEWQDAAGKADNLTKNVQALQNTIDHLENRLEIANIERIDAEEQLFNLRDQKSPFDIASPKLQVSTVIDRVEKKATQDAHMSMSTVFSSGSPTSQDNESHELSTLAAFIAHIERLQDQVRQKDAQIAKLEVDQEQLQQKHDRLAQDHNDFALQLDIQNELLRKTRNTDTHIEQLRTAIIDREATIGEKENSTRAVERQLEHHKLLLQAEIRKNAAMKRHVAVEDNPLPELLSLAGKSDIDRWINKLNQRLKKERPLNEREESANPFEAQVENLQQEIDFYIREIIYFKLDIKGYKSDIRKLKRITSQSSAFGGRASDLDSDTSSLRPATTPSRLRFTSTTPELGASTAASPVLTGPLPASASASLDRPVTPQPSADDIEPGISPRSVARLSPERRKPTPPSPERERFGDLLTNFPLSTPAAPQMHGTQRSMSDSIVQRHATPTTPEMWPALQEHGISTNYRKAGAFRGRSASASDAHQGKTTPERPPRPRYGLFERPPAVGTGAFKLSSAPHVDILAEAMRNPPDQDTSTAQTLLQRNNSNASSIRMAPPPIAKDIRERSVSCPSPMPPTVLRSRAGSNASSTGNFPTQSPPPERKLSVASSSSIPFVIAMGSPHNPALISPTANMPPAACSVNQNAPLKIVPSSLRTGVGGTMASSTPVTSPISPTDASRLELHPQQSSITSSASKTTPPTRKLSLTRQREEQVTRLPPTPSHSRNASGSSIRTAIRLPKTRNKEKEEAHRMRKDSISMPRPLGSPFGMEWSMMTGPERQREGQNITAGEYAYGIGEAI
ncbi:hypothetical protein BKA66DRAFT_513200 [Pyrenochaeta sp. MPI-SDFR-AT-0127]|nr:hypothetical protein BKA66DRAFT_513200 [Pyrenochaeta sp. MPI-SDFR-AT-0127]